MFDTSDSLPFMFGEGSDVKADTAMFTAGLDEETAAMVAFWLGLGDTITKRSLLEMTITDAEEGMTKKFFENYGIDGNYPKDSDLIEFTTVTNSPELHHFLTSNDETCQVT